MSTFIALNQGDLIEIKNMRDLNQEGTKKVRAIAAGFEMDEDYNVSLYFYIGAMKEGFEVDDKNSGVRIRTFEEVEPERLICISPETLEMWGWEMIRKGNSLREMTNFIID